jgi:23S rRNA (adenine2503-C2)-methyltransferase
MENFIEKPMQQHEATASDKLWFYDLDLEELAAKLTGLGVKEKFRAGQIWHWVYHRGVRSFQEMTNVAQPVRNLLEEHFSLNRGILHHAQRSIDGTQKWLLRFQDNQEVETVHIPEVNRGTLCISSQVGCTLTCKFCHTGTQTWVRNLSAGEIISQVLVARDIFSEWPTPFENRHISNIVLMGMGEPLYNYDNVFKALKVIMDGQGIAISKRKITLSTSGVVPMIERCGQELGVNLAISLHAVRNDVRDVLVPLNKKYPLEALLDACRRYPGVQERSQRITFEYVMLDGVNDSPADARELVRLLRGIPAKVNLIPFNPWPGSAFERSTPQAIAQFAEIIQRAGYPSPVRHPRGEDILAACGQLKSKSQRVSKSKRQGEAMRA